MENCRYLKFKTRDYCSHEILLACDNHHLKTNQMKKMYIIENIY